MVEPRDVQIVPGSEVGSLLCFALDTSMTLRTGTQHAETARMKPSVNMMVQNSSQMLPSVRLNIVEYPARERRLWHATCVVITMLAVITQ